jgi:hypothetical protein
MSGVLSGKNRSRAALADVFCFGQQFSNIFLEPLTPPMELRKPTYF